MAAKKASKGKSAAERHQAEVEDLKRANEARAAEHHPAEVHATAAADDQEITVNASGGVVFVGIGDAEARLDREQLIQLQRLLAAAFQAVA